MLDPTCCALTTARSGSTLLCRTLLAYLRHDQGSVQDTCLCRVPDDAEKHSIPAVEPWSRAPLAPQGLGIIP
jgi:hypothetical protein